MLSPSGKQFEIALGEQRAVVVEVGGGLRTYSVAGDDVLDGYGADEMATGGSGQMLIPWPNRLQDGSYEFDGRRHQLPLTDPELPFGGVGNSGMGKYHGRFGFEAFTSARGVLYHSTLVDPGVKYPPYSRHGAQRKLVDKLM